MPRQENVKKGKGGNVIKHAFVLFWQKKPDVQFSFLSGKKINRVYETIAASPQMVHIHRAICDQANHISLEMIKKNILL